MVALESTPFDRTLWREAFAADQPPRFPCPKCYYTYPGGRLKAEQLSRFEQRFVLTMRCDAAACNGVVTIIGEVAPWETEISGQRVHYDEALFPAFCYPAPPIIEGSGAQDGYTALLIEKSSALFWVEPEACLNCLRRIIEGTLDNFGVPQTYVTRAGKEKRSSLTNRIDAFLSTDEHVAESLMALRKIGNIGSHGGEISRKMVLDAYELLHDCLRHLYDLSPVQKLELQVSSQARIDALRAKLRALGE